MAVEAEPAVSLRTTAMVDGNEAAVSVAYRLSELAAIYPITPSSPMGELYDEWASRRRPNAFGTVPRVVEMQSEGGAAGTVHGALQAGALATTFTASQGLLLMLPNMYKIAGELLPFVMHVAARTVATHALSIFGDHGDVMACRQTGFAMLASANVQEAQDLACIAHLATLASRVPFVHFFDGFRTSHEIATIEPLSDDDLRALGDTEAIARHRERALTPDRPSLRGTAQNPDAFFQAREACNAIHDAVPGHVRAAMAAFAARTGRRYDLFDWHGARDADRVAIVIGSAGAALRACVDVLNARGERTAVLQVRLYRPFDGAALLRLLPRTVRAIAVLDRTKEPGAPFEPLCLDVIAALRRAEAAGEAPFAAMPHVTGVRYGLSGKEFTPAMAAAIFRELAAERPRPQCTVGIVDDVTHLSLRVDESFALPPDGTVEALFYGLGADGTVGANKNSIVILGAEPGMHAQGWFVYDSKKSGAVTVSHLRFGPHALDRPWQIARASFVACHQFSFLDRYEVCERAAHGAVLLLNAPHADDAALWAALPAEVQQQIVEKQLRVHAIDASAVAAAVGLPGRINAVMQACFFAIAGVLPRDEAILRIKQAIARTYAKKGEEVVRRNHAAVDAALQHLRRVAIPPVASATRARPPAVAAEAPEFVQRVTAVLLAGKGDLLPVSAFPIDGTWPTDTARWEKRAIAASIPVWDPAICIQCNKCALMCPHAAIRAKVHDGAAVGDGAAVQGVAALGAADHGGALPSVAWRGKEFGDARYTIQVAPDDCTGCGLCVQVCPAKDKAVPRHKAIDMTPVLQPVADGTGSNGTGAHGTNGTPTVRDRERARWRTFLQLPEVDRARVQKLDVRGSQLLQPLFEFSGACAGCGETPYLKLLTQLFGDRLLVANATGCSSIYGGNLPTTPWAKDRHGRGPAWANSLFEDNAEFGLGLRLGADVLAARAEKLLHALAPLLGADELVAALAEPPQPGEAWLAARREQIELLRQRLLGSPAREAAELLQLCDWLAPKSVWLIGGDGWAFDIGYGGLDHVLSTTHDVNVLVLDTEVYSNTGGQASKATPIGAAAKFAARGKAVDKKDLGLMAMQYGHVYVASIAIGASDAHTVRVLREAESYPGPSLVIAYSPCIAHGYDLVFGGDQQKRAVQSGVWPLYHYDPRNVDAGVPPLVVDDPGSHVSVADYMRNEGRFRMVEKIDPEGFRRYARLAQQAASRRMAVYRHIAGLRMPRDGAPHGSGNGSGTGDASGASGANAGSASGATAQTTTDTRGATAKKEE